MSTCRGKDGRWLLQHNAVGERGLCLVIIAKIVACGAGLAVIKGIPGGIGFFAAEEAGKNILQPFHERTSWQ